MNYLAQLSISIGLLAFSFSSCQVKEAFQLPFQSPSNKSHIDFVYQTPSKPIFVAKLDINACFSPKNYPQNWSINFASPVGKHTIQLSKTDETEKAVARIENLKFQITNKPIVSNELVTEACKDASQGSYTYFIKTEDQLKNFKSVLENTAPSCLFDLDISTGLYCQIPTKKPQLVLKELKKIQIEILRRWSRHPYLLARKLAVGATLASALVKDEENKKLDRFCQATTYYLPSELPLAIKAARWKQVACNSEESPKNRMQIALVSLNEILNEIKALKKSMKKNSKLGALSIRIPSNSTPARDLWVSLKPISQSKALADSSENNNYICWHPLFSRTPQLAKISSKLTTISKDTNLSCTKHISLSPSSSNEEIRDYVHNSISSETEFPITNGRGKILRLPMGEYRYTISKHPKSYELWNIPNKSIKSQGLLSWTSRYPRPTIREWNSPLVKGDKQPANM